MRLLLVLMVPQVVFGALLLLLMAPEVVLGVVDVAVVCAAVLSFSRWWS
jgi:hypothetical protein